MSLTSTSLSLSLDDFSKSFEFTSPRVALLLLPRYCRNSTGLGSSPFARQYLGNHFCFLFLLLLRCFSSQRLLLYLMAQMTLRPGCPIRISSDHGLFATPRSFSQLTTSFIASLSPGIHHSLFSFFFFRVRQQIAQNDARASLKRLVSPLSPPQQVVSGTPIKGLRKL